MEWQWECMRALKKATHARHHTTLVPDRPSVSRRRQPRRKPSGLMRVKNGHNVEGSSRSSSENEYETDIKKAIEQHMMKTKKLNEKLTEIQRKTIATNAEKVEPNDAGATQPIPPRRQRCSWCAGTFKDESHVIEFRECQESCHSNCVRPHWQARHLDRRFHSSDEQERRYLEKLITRGA